MNYDGKEARVIITPVGDTLAYMYIQLSGKRILAFYYANTHYTRRNEICIDRQTKYIDDFADNPCNVVVF